SGSVEYSNVLRVEITNTVFKSNGRIKETFFTYNTPDYLTDSHPAIKFENGRELLMELSHVLREYRKDSGILDARFEFINVGVIHPTLVEITEKKNISEGMAKELQTILEERLSS
ncbi:hypothetical protein HOD53_03700, partial [Candidatus Woesearchaeota archaeon]|nr:hypothetical protein [Candidatus Woesearchaeota archaeon]